MTSDADSDVVGCPRCNQPLSVKEIRDEAYDQGRLDREAELQENVTLQGIEWQIKEAEKRGKTEGLKEALDITENLICDRAEFVVREIEAIVKKHLREFAARELESCSVRGSACQCCQDSRKRAKELREGKG